MRQSPPNKKSDASSPWNWALKDRSSSSAADTSNTSQTGRFDSPHAQALMAAFDESLQHDPGLDHEGRDYLRETFQGVLEEVQGGEEAKNKILDRSEWLEMVENLQKVEALDEDETSALIRQLDQMMQPMKRPAVSLALEFNRRCQEDGEEEALQWYRQQVERSSQQPVSAGPRQTDAKPARDSVTQSRSRRLRGPP